MRHGLTSASETHAASARGFYDRRKRTGRHPRRRELESRDRLGDGSPPRSGAALWTPLLIYAWPWVMAFALVFVPIPVGAWHSDAPEQALTRSLDPLQRESAAIVLGTRGALTSVPLLATCLRQDDNPWVRAACAEALGRIGARLATKDLLAALRRAKRPRVRRRIAEALVRLGNRAGLDELLWQLRAGANHDRAEAMEFMVETTGRAFGQEMTPWWSYLAKVGYDKLAARPPGHPAISEVHAKVRFAKGKAKDWQQLSAVVLRLSAARAPVTVKRLRAYEKAHGEIPDGALLLIEARWAEAPPPPEAATRRVTLKRVRRDAGPPPPAGPGLTVAAARYLLKRAPKLLGVGLDAPQLDLPEATGIPVTRMVLKRGGIVLTALDRLGPLNDRGTRLIIVRREGSAPAVLALLP